MLKYFQWSEKRTPYMAGNVCKAFQKKLYLTVTVPQVTSGKEPRWLALQMRFVGLTHLSPETEESLKCYACLQYQAIDLVGRTCKWQASGLARTMTAFSRVSARDIKKKAMAFFRKPWAKRPRSVCTRMLGCFPRRRWLGDGSLKFYWKLEFQRALQFHDIIELKQMPTGFCLVFKSAVVLLDWQISWPLKIILLKSKNIRVSLDTKLPIKLKTIRLKIWQWQKHCQIFCDTKALWCSPHGGAIYWRLLSSNTTFCKCCLHKKGTHRYDLRNSIYSYFLLNLLWLLESGAFHKWDVPR